ncbi:MAG TPA: DNA repair protein RecO [Steroidobacteraceae bacterium]|jgi:DNA repair protein RecO (recombination protein O)|nr:DNA repair protein RecO [Steroidobacteraceae bacterium]
MSAHPRRVLLAPGYVLHHWPYRDTSRILEVLARDHGRLTLFARGARGAKPRFGGVLQPFGLLLLSFHVGREAGQLTGAESGESVPPVPAGSLMAGFYLNELLLKLTTRHDPMVEVFDDYRRALEGLRAGRRIEGVLRIFEKRLLEAVGYGVDLTSEARTGKRVEAAGFYRFEASQGMVPAREADAQAVAGSSLLALAREELGEEGRGLEDARRVLKAVLAERLEGKEIVTRRVARALAGARTR